MANEMRTKFILVCIFIFLALIVLKLFKIQIIDHKTYKEEIEKRIPKEGNLGSRRGEIVSSDGFPLAANLISFDLIAVPAQIKNETETALKLAPYLGFKEEILKQEIIEETEETKKFKDLVLRIGDKTDFYELLAKNLSLEEMIAIKNLNLAGINFETKYQRYYPEKDLFAQVIGFFGWRGRERKGQYGLEEFFDKELSQGDSLFLTLNRSLQFYTAQKLKEALEKYEAEAGTVLISDSLTGEILSLVNLPSFNPDQYSEVTDFSLFKNKAISDDFEPGSIFKIITMAAALEEKKITPETTYVDEGEVKIGSYLIKNAGNRVYNEQTMTGVLENSINTGAIFVARKIGIKTFTDYVKKIGFGEPTGIELQAEAAGDISNLNKKKEIYLATASFGQGLTITPLQMLQAVGVVSSRGELFKPYLVKEIKKQNNKIIEKQAEVKAEILTQEAAIDLTKMMVAVTESGYGKRAQVPGFYIAGKTGTAQVPEKGVYTKKTIHSFVGFLPAYRPRFNLVVKLDNPKKGEYAESTAAPLFAELAKFLVETYNLEPEKE